MNALCVNVMYMSYYEIRLKKWLKDTYPEEFRDTDCFNLSSRGKKALRV